jgi:hypothetical protein
MTQKEWIAYLDQRDRKKAREAKNKRKVTGDETKPCHTTRPIKTASTTSASPTAPVVAARLFPSGLSGSSCGGDAATADWSKTRMSGNPVTAPGDSGYPVMDEIICVHCWCSASNVDQLAYDEAGRPIADPVCCAIEDLNQ